MKLSRMGLFIRVAFVAGVLGTAYYLGLSHPENSAKTKPTSAVMGQNASGHLTRNQAWQQLANLVAQPEARDSFVLFEKFAETIDVADIPFLLQQLSALKLSDHDGQMMMRVLFNKLAEEDPEQALSLLDKYFDPVARDEEAKRVYSFLVDKDPQQALAELAALPQGKRAEALYGSTFSAWTAYDPDSQADAIAAALALPPGPERDEALRGVAAGLRRGVANSETDQALLDWAVSLPATDSAALQTAVLSVAEDQPQLAAQYLDKLTDASARNQAIGVIATTMSQSDPAAALNFLDQSATGATFDQCVKALFTQLANNDPATGATLLGNLTDQADRNAAIAQLAQHWSGTDPSDAMTWAESLPPSDGAARASALNTVMTNWVKYDPQGAIAYAQSSTDATLVLAAAPALAQALAQTDPQAALNFVGGLPDGAQKSQALNTVLAGIAQSDFPASWNYAAALPAGDVRDGAMGSLVGTLAKTNAAQAAGLIDQFGGDSAGLTATAAVVSDWVQQDLTAATAWVNALPPGPQLDAALVPLSSSQIAKHPSAALNLANSIGDNALRIAQVKNVLRQWGKTDPVAAANAAQTANLPPSQLAALLTNIATAKPAPSGN